MSGVLIGFGIIGAIVAAGYAVGRADLLGPGAGRVLSRLAFFVLSPCLLFTVLARADVHALFSSLLLTSAVAAFVTALLFAGVALLVWRRSLPEVVVGSLASGYVNANNIGLPVAVYVLGDPAYSAPVILLQLVVLAPIALTLLDISTSGHVSLGRILQQPVRNPLIIGSLLGLVVAVTGIQLPDPVLQPFELIGAAAVPVVLLGFGMSLHGQRPFQPGTGRRDIALATGLKLVVMPAVAALVGALLGLEGAHLYAVVVLAALPSAQNVFNYAQRYDRGVVVARDTVLLTTVGSIPVLLLVSLLLRR
ncbi:AEC family transporter [Naasia aerilata]|uniref:Membrane protein n=1 Tax=Naasia aerilata TaxID=1162966 RepID=A0ABN6XPE0_9MICO|nr:AEC family transporter [Naasia aerilata]BDZ45293.1 membrane protein [Naasia aerilata]